MFESVVRRAAVITILCLVTVGINVVRVRAEQNENGNLNFKSELTNLESEAKFIAQSAAEGDSTINIDGAADTDNSLSTSTPISAKLLEDLTKKIEQNDDYKKNIKPYVKSVSVGIDEPWIILNEEELKQLEKDRLFDSKWDETIIKRIKDAKDETSYRAIQSKTYSIKKIHEKTPLYSLQYRMDLDSLLKEKLNAKIFSNEKLTEDQVDTMWKDPQPITGKSALEFASTLHTTLVNIASKLDSGLSKDILLRRIRLIVSSPKTEELRIEKLNLRKQKRLDAQVDRNVNEIDALSDSDSNSEVSDSLDAMSSLHTSEFRGAFHNHLPGGVSFGKLMNGGSVGSGTLGGILIDARGQRYSLTNRHVASNEGTLSCHPSQDSWQLTNPNCYLINQCCPNANQISRSIAASTNPNMDWSVGKIDHTKATTECRIEDIGYLAGAQAVPVPYVAPITIRKHGSRTHLTHGYIYTVVGAGNEVNARARSGEWPAFANGNPQNIPAPGGNTYPGNQPFARPGIVAQNEQGWFYEKKRAAIDFIRGLVGYNRAQARAVFENLFERGQTSLFSDGGDSGSWYVSRAPGQNGLWNARVLHDSGMWDHEDCVGSPRRWRDAQGNYWCYLYKAGSGKIFTDVIADVNLRIAARINLHNIITAPDRAAAIAARAVRVCTQADGNQQNVAAQVGPPPLAGSAGWSWP